jgi:cell wall-associated NlpC family hydrolase
MAKRTDQQRVRHTISPVLRPIAWSALLSAAAAIAFASPGFADPTRIPDAGVRPAPAGALQLPGAAPPQGVGPTTVPVSGLLSGPLATKIHQKDVELATVGDQLLKLRQDHALAVAERDAAETEWKAARQALAEAQRVAEEAAAEALKDAAALPPGAYGSDLHGLSLLRRIQRGEQPATRTEATRMVADAQAAERSAHEAYAAADARARSLETQIATLDKTRRQLEADLAKLKRDNQAQLAAIEREQEALDQRLGAKYVNSGGVAGMGAHSKALAAVQYALKQLGDPYEWAAEGPDRFDCSGLVWAAYRSVGYTLPRVAKDQYYATRGKTVDRSALLPGDLIFFASGSSWQSIYHVGMYIGGGKMVEAPRTGDVVKISTVRWSRFYAATRVFDAVAAPKPDPVPSSKPSPSPSRSPKPSPTPSKKPSPSPTKTASPTPTRPGPTPTRPSPSPSTSSPSVSPSPSETPDPDPSDSGASATPEVTTASASG